MDRRYDSLSMGSKNLSLTKGTVYKTTYGVFIFSDHGVQMPFGEGSKVNTPLPTAADSQTGQKANKRFQQQPMCRNPLFSAVFPIFCSFPLYQLSGLHFGKMAYACKTIFFLHNPLTLPFGWICCCSRPVTHHHGSTSRIMLLNRDS